MLALKKFIPCYAAALCITTHTALLARGSNRTSCYNWPLRRLTSRMRRLFPKQVRASTVRSELDSTNCFFPTCARIHVSYVELDFGDGVQGKGAVALPLLSYLEAVLAARTVPIALFSSNSGAGGLIVGRLIVYQIPWDRCPTVAAHPMCRAWLTFQSHRGLAENTLDAYSRGLEIFLRFLSDQQLPVPAVTRVHIGTYLASLQSNDRCLSNATVQQRLTVLRLFYSYLVEEGVCKKNPVGQDGISCTCPPLS